MSYAGTWIVRAMAPFGFLREWTKVVDYVRENRA
jgi:hypothetical protein